MVAFLRDAIEVFKEVMPVVEELANPALKRRHWDAIFGATGAKIMLDENTGNYEVRARCLRG